MPVSLRTDKGVNDEELGELRLQRYIADSTEDVRISGKGLRRRYREFPVEPSEITAAVIIVALLSGFLAYVAGGYAAGRSAQVSGGLNGAMTAVFGVIVGVISAIILAIFGIIFTEAVAVPPVNFGLAGAAIVGGLILFLVNLLGGFVGGKLGKPSGADRRA